MIKELFTLKKEIIDYKVKNTFNIVLRMKVILLIRTNDDIIIILR